jgi:zinc transporter ZupT
MELGDLLLITFVAALITDLATGLGAVPFFFVPRLPARFNGVLMAGAAGMMTIASVLQLLGEARRRVPGFEIWEVVLGLLAGVAFFHLAANWVKTSDELDVGRLRESGGLGALLIVAAMTIHSLPEGVAIGVAYGTAGQSGETTFGFAVALALAVHNIPEGLAITAALRGKGATTLACMGWAVVSSIPQPLAAVPAAWAVWLFQPLLPAGLGFAAGAMMYLVAFELIPEASEKAGRAPASAAFCVGLAVMLALTALVGITDVQPA